MSDIALTLPAANRAASRDRAIPGKVESGFPPGVAIKQGVRAAKAPFAALRSACIYLAFALSVAFTFAVVVGVIH